MTAARQSERGTSTAVRLNASLANAGCMFSCSATSLFPPLICIALNGFHKGTEVCHTRSGLYPNQEHCSLSVPIIRALGTIVKAEPGERCRQRLAKLALPLPGALSITSSSSQHGRCTEQFVKNSFNSFFSISFCLK